MLKSRIRSAAEKFPFAFDRERFAVTVFSLSLLITSTCFSGISSVSQTTPSGPYRTQEISETDGLPVIFQHLPRRETVRGSERFIASRDELNAVLGQRPVLDAIEFTGGTEAAYAPYDVGKLLIVEFATPQAAAFADEKINAWLAQTPAETPVVYRRVGNYSVFVFDPADAASASSLIDEVKYEKTIQWLGEDPFSQEKLERYVAIMTRDVAVSTFLWVTITGSSAAVIGVISGFVFFRYRERGRKTHRSFSDAGGLTRLNLDGLSEPAIDERLP